jgi:GNAT superfamily N-acetyltransferase
MSATHDRVPLKFYPLTPTRWPDLEALFGRSGACSGCWCMWWRMTGAEFSRRAGEGARRAFQRLTADGRRPGILAYHDGRPVGWVSVALREEFLTRLSAWTPFRTVDPGLTAPDRRVWSVVCFFIQRRYRGRGIAHALLHEAVRYARSRGARIVEAYPVDPAEREVTYLSAYPGTVPMYREAGFREVVRAYPARPIMRLTVRRVPQSGRNRAGRRP